MSDPGPTARPVRRRVEADTREPDPGRTGCLWVGGVLGVVAGVLFTFFLLPSILDWAFPPEHVAVGETFAHEGHVVTVRELSQGDASRDPAGSRRWRVLVELTANRSWKLGLDTFELRLEDGTEVPVTGIEGGDFVADDLRLPLGEPELVTLVFVAPNDSPPEKLLLDEPQAEFALPPVAVGD
ncbi:MAG: hypothetical protein ACM3S1_06590 [Hyphomicrobiales bacterium]